MSDRIKGFLVVLSEDIRDDDAVPIREAIAQLRGVSAVVPQVANIDDTIAEMRVRARLREKIWDLIR